METWALGVPKVQADIDLQGSLDNVSINMVPWLQATVRFVCSHLKNVACSGWSSNNDGNLPYGSRSCLILPQPQEIKLSSTWSASHLTLLCRQGHQPLWLLRQSRCEHTMSSEDTLSSEAIVALDF